MKKLVTFLGLLALAAIVPTLSSAQEPPPPSAYEAAQMAGASFISTKEFTLSITVLIFGLLSIGLLVLFQRQLGNGELSFKAIALIITLTLAVVVLFAGYSDAQITPVIGLLGTAIGYALGRNERDKPDANASGRNNAAGR